MARGRATALACVLLLLWAAGCQAEDDEANAFCVSGGELVGRGRCLSLCEWQCRVAAAAECESPACVELCRLSRQSWTTDCLEAAHDAWYCGSIEGRGPTRCTDDGVTFSAGDGSCQTEQSRARNVCGLPDPLRLDPGPPLCEWQCRYAKAIDCDVPRCQNSCQDFHAGLAARATDGADCLDAVERLWVCMAESGRAATTCGPDRIEFGRAPNTCEQEVASAEQACNDNDPTRIPIEPTDGGRPRDAQ